MNELLGNLGNLRTVPLKSVINKMKNGYSGTQVLEETEYRVSRIETISDGTVNLEKVGFVEKNDKLKEYKLECGDLLFSNINSLAMVGKTAIFDFDQENLYAGMNLLMIRPKQNVDSKWLYYVINSYYFNQLVKANAKHAINQVSIPTSKIKELPIVYVEYKEQIKIKKYLDTKTLLIDQLIKTKESLIDKISQQYQSIITEAVTKGLNPNMKMKDSGVEWIGDIPEHWEVNKIKFKFDIRKVIQPTENPTVLSLTQRGLKIKDLNDFSGQHADSYDKYQKVEIKDYVMNGMDLLTGYVDCSPFEGVTSPDYRVFRLKDNTECHDYYLRYFQICYFAKIFYGHGQGVSNFGRWRLQTDVFKEFPIPVPPKDEQFEVSEYLKAKEIEINKALELIKLDIEKLKEYRQALIYEAVTGKIDVRDMALD